MKISLVFLAALLSLASFDSNFYHKAVIWQPGLQLSWNDFEGRKQHSTDVDAVTSCGIMCIPKYTSEGDVQFEISCYFSKQDSWVNHRDANEELLRHEQGHFDIGEIYARKLRYRLRRTDFDKKVINDQIQAIYDLNFQEYKKAQEVYDRQTHHSMDREAQSVWEHWIDKQLHKYRNYSDRFVTAAIK